MLLYSAFVVSFQLPWVPPPPPPPPPPSDYLEQDLMTLAALLGCLLLAMIYYVKSNWTAWFDTITLAAFKDVDRDGSGDIDHEESYLCVVCLYLMLNEYGVKCCAPDRATVRAIFDATDMDKSGRLNYEEFRKTIFVLSQQTAGRFIFQLVGTIMCPVLASIIFEYAAPYLPTNDGVLPHRVVRVASLIPEAVPVLIISFFIFKFIWPWGTAAVDHLSEYGAERIAKNGTPSGKGTSGSAAPAVPSKGLAPSA